MAIRADFVHLLLVPACRWPGDAEPMGPAVGDPFTAVATRLVMQRRRPAGLVLDASVLDDERQKLRHDRWRPVIDKIVEWFYRTLPTRLPGSGLHKAIGYMVHRCPGLLLLPENPRVPRSNNGTERAARGPVVDRQNHYGSHSPRGTEATATFYRLVESAKLNRLEPRFQLNRLEPRFQLNRLEPRFQLHVAAAEGKLNQADYDACIEGIANAALAAAARAAPAPEASADGLATEVTAPPVA